MHVKIGALSEGDKEDWKGLWSKYLEFYETDLPDAVYESTWTRLLSDDEQEFHGLIAKDEAGTALGIVHFLFHRSCWTIENVCYLQDLYVAESARGHRVGRKLIEAVYEKADQLNQGRVYWLTQDFNQKARILYDNVALLTPFIKYQRKWKPGAADLSEAC